MPLARIKHIQPVSGLNPRISPHLTWSALLNRFPVSGWVVYTALDRMGAEGGSSLSGLEGDDMDGLAVDLPKGREGAAAARRVRIVVIASGKGGSGKTTTTRNLAVAATQAGFAVGTVDLDESPTLTTWIGKRPGDVPRIEHVAMPLNRINPREPLDKKLSSIEGVDILFVDTPPSLPEHPQRAKELFKSADLLIIPTQQYDEDIDAVSAWAAAARDSQIEVLVLLNRTQRREKSLELAKRRLVKVGALCPIDIPHFADIPKTFRHGVGVSELRGAKGGPDYEAIMDHLRRALRI